MTGDPLRELLVDGLPDETIAEVQGHVEQGSARCAFPMREGMAHATPDLFASLLSFSNPAIGASERFAAFGCAVRQIVHRALTVEGERRLGPTLLEEIERRPAEACREAIRRGPRYQLYGFADYLAEESRKAGFQPVLQVQELAELSVEVADAPDPSAYVDSVVTDGRARKRAFLGNSRRVPSDPFSADGIFEEALFPLEHGSDSEMVRGETLSLLAWWLIEAGDPLEALATLEKARPTNSHSQDDSWFQLLRTWQAAQIDAALGDAACAEPLLAAARQTATGGDHPYEPAMINLEVAILHLNQEDTTRVQHLAEGMDLIFRSLELQADAMAAVHVLQYTARSQTVTVRLAKELLLYLRRPQDKPNLAFQC